MICRSVIVSLFAALIALSVSDVLFAGQLAKPDETPSAQAQQTSDSDAIVTGSPTAEGANPTGSDNVAVEDGGETDREIVPLITNDAVIFGILMVMLGLIFWSSNSSNPVFRRFYKIVPMLLVCYFLPSLLTFFHIVDHHESNLYSSRPDICCLQHLCC